MRLKSLDESQREKLLAEMSRHMEKHVFEVTLRHDISRVVQCLLQFGTSVQRDKVLVELLPHANEIARTPYGHFTLLKAISYCTAHDEQERIAKALKGHFVSLGTNVIGARIVETFLSSYPGALSRSLKAEFYGNVCSGVFFIM